METERFLSWYKHRISNELDVWLYKSWRISNEEVAEKIVVQYNREVDGCRIAYPEINPILLLITIRNTFEVFIHKIKDKKAKECVIAAFNNNLMCRTAIDTEITLFPIGIKKEGSETKKPILQALQNMSQQQAPINHMERLAKQPQYKPTLAQEMAMLRDIANANKGKLVEVTNDFVEVYEYYKPRQIEMPPLEINRSEHKAVNLFWDTLESIYMPNK